MEFEDIFKTLCETTDTPWQSILYQLIFYSLRNLSRTRIIESLEKDFQPYVYETLYDICLENGNNFKKYVPTIFEHFDEVDTELFELFAKNFIDSLDSLLIENDDELLEKYTHFLDITIFSSFIQFSPHIFPQTMEDSLNEEVYLQFIESQEQQEDISLPILEETTLSLLHPEIQINSISNLSENALPLSAKKGSLANAIHQRKNALRYHSFKNKPMLKKHSFSYTRRNNA